jgi:hypothetical protein
MALGSLTLPGIGLEHAAWLLPALGLSFASVALATWVRIELAASGLALVWVLGLAVASWLHAGHTATASLAPLRAPGQIFCAALAITAVAVLAARRDRLATIAMGAGRLT